MFRHWIVVPVVVVLFVLTAAAAEFPVTNEQFSFCSTVHPSNLYCFLPTFGFRSLPIPFALQSGNALRLSQLFGIESATLPMPSPASGVTYEFDSKLGVFTRSADSFGPILSDRAVMLGRGKVAAGFMYQHYGFDSLDGQSLKNNFDLLAQSVDLELDQFITFVTWGVTQRLDVAAAIPVRTVRIAATGLGFQLVNGLPVVVPLSDHGGATGLSDITFRAKALVLRTEHGGVAVGIDVRTPTGKPLDFLGAGTAGVKPFIIASHGMKLRRFYVDPHLNVGFEWNGSSILGGALLGMSGRLPRRFVYAAGAEVGFSRRATITLDLNGQRLFSAERFYVFNQFIQPTSVNVTAKSLNLIDGAVGAKFNPVGNLVLSGNLSWRLDTSGLRARMVPLAGISYTF